MAFPAIIICLISEYAKAEKGSGVTAVGIYGPTPHARVPPQVGGSLTFIFFSDPVSDTQSTFSIGMQIVDSQKEVLINAPPFSFNPAAVGNQTPPGIVTIVGTFQGLNLSAGSYFIKVTIDGAVHYESGFTVRSPAK